MKRLLIPLVILASTGHAAEIKKWVDESGQVHYGDSPPATTQSEQIRVTRPPSNPGRALPRLGNEAEKTNGEQTAAPQQAEPQASDEEKSTYCKKAQDELRVINNNQRIRVRAADGTTRYLTQEEIEQRKAQSEADIARYCQ